MKENWELVDNDLAFGKYSDIDIANMIELTYILTKDKDLSILNETICNYSADGVNTFAVFIKFCYEYYMTDGKNKYWSLWEMADEEYTKLEKEFIKHVSFYKSTPNKKDTKKISKSAKDILAEGK